MGSNKDQGEVGIGKSPKGVSGKWKRERSVKKYKNVQTKTNIQRSSVAIEVLLHPRLQKSLLLLLKSIILKKELQALQAFIFFIFFIISIFFLGVLRD